MVLVCQRPSIWAFAVGAGGPHPSSLRSCLPVLPTRLPCNISTALSPQMPSLTRVGGVVGKFVVAAHSLSTVATKFSHMFGFASLDEQMRNSDGRMTT